LYETKAFMTHVFDTTEARRQLVELLADAGVGGLSDHPDCAEFINGTSDIPLEALAIDSLALMEIGIALEDSFEVSLSPYLLGTLNTLGELWSAVIDGQSRGA
jgi:acyl carrier protein